MNNMQAARESLADSYKARLFDMLAAGAMAKPDSWVVKTDSGLFLRLQEAEQAATFVPVDRATTFSQDIARFLARMADGEAMSLDAALKEAHDALADMLPRLADLGRFRLTPSATFSAAH